jgi:hypothetical protein
VGVGVGSGVGGAVGVAVGAGVGVSVGAALSLGDTDGDSLGDAEGHRTATADGSSVGMIEPAASVVGRAPLAHGSIETLGLGEAQPGPFAIGPHERPYGVKRPL